MVPTTLIVSGYLHIPFNKLLVQHVKHITYVNFDFGKKENAYKRSDWLFQGYILEEAEYSADFMLFLPKWCPP